MMGPIKLFILLYFFTCSVSNIEELEYRKVKVRGEFDYSKEVLMGPRALVNYDDRSGELSRGIFSSSSGNNGYLVITPFRLEGKRQ